MIEIVIGILAAALILQARTIAALRRERTHFAITSPATSQCPETGAVSTRHAVRRPTFSLRADE